MDAIWYAADSPSKHHEVQISTYHSLKRNLMFDTKLNDLRIEAKEAGLYVIEESPNKWSCIRKVDNCLLTRGERSESLALSCGLARTKFL